MFPSTQRKMEAKNQHQHEAEGLNPVSKKQLSLESYFNVRASADYNALPIRDLNQILAIHGFKQLHKAKKIELVEAVRAVELKDFSRSTIGECIKPAPMSLTEVIEDLSQLSGQTCPVVSVRSFNSPHDGLAGLKSEKKKKKPGQGSMKKSGRSGEQDSFAVSTKSIDSAQYSTIASSTSDIEASVGPAGLNSEKKKLETGPESVNKSGGQSGKSGEQAQYSDVASARYTVTIPIPDKLVMNSGAELARKHISCDHIGKSGSSGGDDPVDLKNYTELVTGASYSSSVMADMETMLSNKRKRKVVTKSIDYLCSEGMLNLSKELGMFP